jgi:ADP-ribose pyrophosphatase
MKRRVTIIEQTEVFKQAVFRIQAARLSYEKYDGTMSDEITRLSLERGDSVAAVVHRISDDVLIFTEQFRYPTVAKGPGWLLEIPAGMVDGAESPEAAMRRELEEEIGYTVKQLRPISTFYVSPGGTSERIHLFYAAVSVSDSTGSGGGLPNEGENIRMVALQLGDIMAKMASGDIQDAKTLIGLLWLQANRHAL